MTVLGWQRLDSVHNSPQSVNRVRCKVQDFGSHTILQDRMHAKGAVLQRILKPPSTAEVVASLRCDAKERQDRSLFGAVIQVQAYVLVNTGVCTVGRIMYVCILSAL